MKKLLTLVLCAVMVLTMIPAVTLTTSAAGEGDWVTRRKPDGYDDETDYVPAGGYYYDSEGFHTTSPDFTNMNPFYAVVSKETFNLKEGFSMKVRVDNFSYKGEDGKADEWISFSIGDNSNLNPGDSTMGFGSGWVSLVRGTGDGKPQIQSFWSHEKDADGNGSAFAHQGDTYADCELDEQGREIYTFDVAWDGSAYDIKVNGVSVGGAPTISTNLTQLVESGDFYIGIHLHSGASGGVAAISILEVNGSKPTGSDSKDAEENIKVFGEPIDPATVGANQPALIFDARKLTFNKDPDMQNTRVEAKGDNSYALTPSAGVTFLSWSIKNSITYMAEDFPVFTMLTRNITAESGQLYYLGGKNMSAGEAVITPWSLWDDNCDEFEIGEDYYNLVIVDLSEKDDEGKPLFDFTGRINGYRVDFGGMAEDETFDICWMGSFRSVEEAKAYTQTYLAQFGTPTTEPDTTAPVTAEVPTEPDTPAVGEETTAAPESGAATTAGPAATTASSDDTGCSSMVGGAAVVVMAAVAAAVALKKKH